jgi:hypothetical protein
MKLMLFLFDVLYETKKQISCIDSSCLASRSDGFWFLLRPNSSHPYANFSPRVWRSKLLNVDLSTSATYQQEKRFPQFPRITADAHFSPHILHFLSRTYRAKLKFGYYLHKKNLCYVSSISIRYFPTESLLPSLILVPIFWFCLLGHANKRHRQYKHLMLNTVVGLLSAIVYIKSQRSAFFLRFPGPRHAQLRIPSSRSNDAPKGGPTLLAHFQLRVEFIHFLLYFFALPSRLPYQHFSYFSLSSFSVAQSSDAPTTLSRARPSSTAISGAAWLLSKRTNSIDTRLDLQLPKLRKSSYRRTSFSFFCLPLHPFRSPGFLRFSLTFPSSNRPSETVGFSFCLRAFVGLRSAVLVQPALPSPSPSLFERFSLFDPRIHHNLLSC